MMLAGSGLMWSGAQVYGKLNHNIRCTLRGYRNLMGDFTGNTVYTGFKKIYSGKSQLQVTAAPLSSLLAIGANMD